MESGDALDPVREAHGPGSVLPRTGACSPELGWPAAEPEAPAGGEPPLRPGHPESPRGPIAGHPAVGPVGLCIVGCGRFAMLHARAARRLRPRVALSFASREASRAEVCRRRFGGTAAFGSYEAAARDPRVHALVVCTPHHLHLEHVRLAARHGKAVLLEKPIARTVVEADELLRVAREAGIVLLVGENFHFMPAFAAARALLRQGLIGRVRQVLVAARGYRRPTGWRRRREETGGGLLIDGGVHWVHLLRDWGGAIATVSALAPPRLFPEVEGEDTVFLLARFESGAVGLLANSLAAPRLPRWQWSWVSGDGGSLGVDSLGRTLWLRARGESRFRIFLRDRRGLAAQLTEFVAALREGRPPLLPPESTREDLAVVRAAYRSLETGQPVRVVDAS
jgi:UDP-N-acetyl-2-amino-2-deoxyglucuronate dehydrogenase